MNTVYRDITTMKTSLKSKLLNMLLLLVAVVTVTACSNDEDSTAAQTEKVNVRMVFVAGAHTDAMRGLNDFDATATTVKNENIMRDLTVAIFDNTGIVIGYYSDNVADVTQAVQTINITTHAAPNCTIYAIANAVKDYFNDCTTKAQYDAKKTPTLTSGAALGQQNKVIMFGKAENQNIVQGATIGIIQMEHICSKVDLIVIPKISENITVTGWNIHDVPDGAYITDANKSPWTGGFLDDFTAITGHNITTQPADPVATYYLYQNYAGTVTGLTTEKDRNKNNVTTLTKPSYLTIDAKSMAWESVFTVYLGGGALTGAATDDFNDFNVYRNYHYTVTVKIDGAEDPDVRIEKTMIQPITITAVVGDWVDGTASLPDDSGISAGNGYGKSYRPLGFTVNDYGSQVVFSPCNLQATWNGSIWNWGFATNPWDYIAASNPGNVSINGDGTVGVSDVTVDLFGWVGNSNTTWTGTVGTTGNAAMHGICFTNSVGSSSNYGDKNGNQGETLKSDWGEVFGTTGGNWRTLSSAEWTYLLNTRTTGGTVFGTAHARYTHAIVTTTDNTQHPGLILFPDVINISSSEVTSAGPVNTPSSWATLCSYAQWLELADKGCVFLPVAGTRFRGSIGYYNTYGYYWTSTPHPTNSGYSYILYIGPGFVNANQDFERSNWCSVRLVRDF